MAAEGSPAWSLAAFTALPPNIHQQLRLQPSIQNPSELLTYQDLSICYSIFSVEGHIIYDRKDDVSILLMLIRLISENVSAAIIWQLAPLRGVLWLLFYLKEEEESSGFHPRLLFFPPLRFARLPSNRAPARCSFVQLLGIENTVDVVQLVLGIEHTVDVTKQSALLFCPWPPPPAQSEK